MEETKYLKQEYLQDEEEKSSFDIKQIYTILVLNWKWFVLSIIICLGVAYIYLLYELKRVNYHGTATLELVTGYINEPRMYAKRAVDNVRSLMAEAGWQE